MGGFVRKITGVTAQKRAGREAAGIQQDATDKALEYTEQATAPFRTFGESALPGAQQFIDDPSGASYLQNNPLFQQAINYTGNQLKQSGAASGKLNSGSMVQSLFDNYMATGDQYVNSGFNRAMAPVQFGGNVATGNASTVSNLLTNNANAQGAALIQGGNAQSGLFNNIVTAGSTILGGAKWSDKRLKTNIKSLGEDGNGNNVYSYNYTFSPDKYVGYMAQEIQKTDPDHVMADSSGYLKVSSKYAPVRVG